MGNPDLEGPLLFKGKTPLGGFLWFQILSQTEAQPRASGEVLGVDSGVSPFLGRVYPTAGMCCVSIIHSSADGHLPLRGQRVPAYLGYCD